VTDAAVKDEDIGSCDTESIQDATISHIEWKWVSLEIIIIIIIIIIVDFRTGKCYMILHNFVKNSRFPVYFPSSGYIKQLVQKDPTIMIIIIIQFCSLASPKLSRLLP
jgi:hypothetical protein